MALSVLTSLFVTWGVASAEEQPKQEKTLTFVRDASFSQNVPPAAFTVPPPTVLPGRPDSIPLPSPEVSPPQRPANGAADRPPPTPVVYQEQDATGVLPGPSRLFKRISEKDVFDEIRGQARRKPGAARAIFPEDTIISKDKWMGRNWSPMIETVEPNYVGHGRLYFEQQNFERGGWDFGILQPMVSLGVFYADVITFPYQFWTRPMQRYDASAGKCLPGDPSPLFLYPPELSLTGLTAEGAGVVGLLVLFPR